MTTPKLAFFKLLPSPQVLNDSAPARNHFEATKSLMTALGGLLAKDRSQTVSLEIVAKQSQISYLIVVPEDQAGELTSHLYATLPTAELERQINLVIFDAPGELAGGNVQFSPGSGALRDAEFAGPDPLQPVLEMLSSVKAGERLVVQLTLSTTKTGPDFFGATADALGELAKLIINGRSESTESTAPDDKTANAQLQANLRLIALADSQTTATALVRRAVAAFHGFAIPGKTSLRYEVPKHLKSWLTTALYRRPQTDTSFLLTPAEAANLWHTPLNVRGTPQLAALNSTLLPIPDNLPGEGIAVGRGAFRGSQSVIRLAPADRLRHTYLIGQTGTGKSTLFQSAILQDITNGDGCCFIDPHGEVIDWLLPRIPAHRAKDVVLFDPSDPHAILGLNLLEWRTPHERDLLIQELIQLFYKLFDPDHTGIIGPQFEHWLRNAALTVTEPSVRGTLVDIPRLFTDKTFAAATIAKSQHWAVRDFWHNQMAQTADFHKSEMLNYFTSKFGSFLGNAVMYDILSQQQSAFDIRTLMDRRKILLVNLSKGRLGSLNAQLLGTLIVTKIQMAAMSRADTPADQRAPFYVYIDEFQNVVTDTFASMLSEIRKYGVGLHLAHQYIDQLPENVRQAVAGNIGTLIAFRLGRTDANWLANQFAPLTADDLTGIAPYHFHLRTLASGQLVPPFTVRSLAAPSAARPEVAAAIRQRVHRFAVSQPATSRPAASSRV
ncbi:MAG TPA: type IV secretion system DNA-binding domain-containing protein [Candidatus Saccharimonadia bacterium]